MNVSSAREIIEWIQTSIRSLSLMPEYGSKQAVYREIVELSGLSYSMVVKLDSGEHANPSANNLDKLTTAIKAIYQKLAA